MNLNKKPAFFVLLCLFGLPLMGCVTYQDQRTRQAMQEREDILLLQEDIRRLAGRVEGLELQIDRLYRDQSDQRSAQDQWSRSQTQSIDTRIGGIERQIQEIQRGREADKKEIVDSLTATIDRVMRAQQQATRSAPAAPARSHSGFGYEHTVGPGETLSHIATAYGVTARVIIEANQLTNPDVLRVGQKLFIPE